MCHENNFSAKPSRWSRVLSITFPLVLIVATLWLLYPVFLPGYLIYRDQPVTLAMACSAVTNLFPSGDIFGGWEMANSAGYPNLLYYSKAGFWLIGAIHYLLGISVELSHKIAVITAVMAPVLAIYLVLKRISNELFALLFALVFLLQDNLIYYTLNGQWNYSLGLAGVIAVIAASIRFLKKPTFSRTALMSVLTALTFYAHLYAGLSAVIFLAVTAVLALVRHKPRRLTIAYLSGLTVAVTLMLLPYAIPVMTTSGWLAGAGEGPIPSPVGAQAIFGSFFFLADRFRGAAGLARILQIAGNAAYAAIIVLFAVGVFSAFTKKGGRRRVQWLAVMIFTALCLILSSGFWLSFGGIRKAPLLAYTKIHGYRFMALARFGMLIIAAFGSGWLLERFQKCRQTSKTILRRIVPAVLAVFLMANVPIFFGRGHPQRTPALLATSRQLEFWDDVQQIWQWLKENAADEQVRVFFQDTLGNFKLRRIKETENAFPGSRPIKIEQWKIEDKAHFSHLMAPAVFFTGVPQVGSWTGGNLWPTEQYLLSENGLFFGQALAEVDMRDLVIEKKYLQRLNIKYIVSCEPVLKSKLSGSNLFQHEFESGSFTIFSLKQPLLQPGWAVVLPPAAGKVIETNLMRNRIKIDLETSRPGAELLVKMACHPFWKCWIDGSQTPVEQDEMGLIRLPKIPQGKHLIELGFKNITPGF